MKEKTTEEGNFKIIITQRLPERNKHLNIGNNFLSSGRMYISNKNFEYTRIIFHHRINKGNNTKKRFLKRQALLY